MLFRPSKRPSLFDHAFPVMRQWFAPASQRLRLRFIERSARLEKRFSRPGKIIWITLFCLSLGGYSFSLLVQAITAPPSSSPKYLRATPMIRPRPPHLPDTTMARLQRDHSATPDSLSLFPSTK